MDIELICFFSSISFIFSVKKICFEKNLFDFSIHRSEVSVLSAHKIRLQR